MQADDNAATPVFPFTAVVGQENLKTALILASIEPRLGGVLISGPRGCAKSTLARGLAGLHPGGEGRFVTLPLGATEEQLTGSLDLQKALGEQSVAFNPGLLAKAHGGVLYVDEVNLLPDPLVDSLLDVSASGVNRVERDGISRTHAAEFLLVGTMNPDEGELRPQLLDRFGLSVELTTPEVVAERAAIMRQRIAFEQAPQAFVERYAEQEADLRARIETARAAYSGIEFPADEETRIVEQCLAAGVEGVRADITWRKAAAAHAAWQGNQTVTATDVDAVAELVLSHRRGQDPTSSGSSPPPGSSNDDSGSGTPGGNPGQGGGNDGGQGGGDWGGMPPSSVSPGQQRRLQVMAPPADPLTTPANKAEQSSASAERSRGKSPGGRAGAAGQGRRDGAIDWFRTLVARQLTPADASPAVHHRPQRQVSRTLNCVLLDASGSTLGNGALADAEAVVLSIAQQSYQHRQQLAILAFGNEDCQWVLPPRRAPRDCRPYLSDLPAGGGTPLRRALLRVRDRIIERRRQEPDLIARVYLLTDGLSRNPVHDIKLTASLTVIDTERARVPLGRCRALAQELGGEYQQLAEAAPLARATIDGVN